MIRIITIGIFVVVTSVSRAQFSIHVNIGNPPSWGSTSKSDADYYYLPEVESYYDIRATQFIFIRNGRWIRSRYLPRRFRNYDLKQGQKVVLNEYHGKKPYVFFHNHSRNENKGYRNSDEPQRNIGIREENHGYGSKNSVVLARRKGGD